MTLTETASLTKKLLIFGSIALLLITVGGVGYQSYRKYQLSKIPPPQEKPDVKWSILPKPNLPQPNVSSSNYFYTLDTTTGSVPKDIPKIIKIYFIPEAGIGLLAADKARDLASNFKFPNGPETVSDTKHLFNNDTGGLFMVDLRSGNFNYKYNIASDTATEKYDTLPSENQIITDFINYLEKKDLLNDQLKEGRTKVIYEKTSLKESSSAAVSLWQQNVDGLKIVTDKFITGLVNTVITKFKNEPEQFPEMDFTFWPIDETNFSTYPVKSAETAFEQLKTGLGTVVVEPSKPQVSIINISLAYFLSKDYQQYLQPVFLFEGGDFAALVPAVSDEYLEK